LILTDAGGHGIPELDAHGLRRFGLTTGALLAGLFGLILPWLFGRGHPIWPWGLAAVLVVWSVVAPATLGPVYRGWMRVGLLLSRITTPVILAIVYFLLFTPVAVFMRWSGRDALARRLDARAASYRVASARRPPAHMEKPF
jgi:hypothetical protein